MSLANGSMLGFRYALERRVGAGGYSEVWRAHDSVLDRPVAIKLLHSARAEHDETLVRFRNEAQLAGRLAHVNVARVYDFCDSQEGLPPYLVMELIDGPSLAEILAAGPLDPARAMDIVAQVAAGLQDAHAAGLVHRDVKPANIMLAPGGVVKITDFGLSHTLGSAPITGTGLLIGTPGYFAPERAAGARATPAGDLYSLGVVGYECLAGTVPFTGPPLEVALAHRERPLPPLPDSVPAEVAGFIAQLTMKDPAGRPASADMACRQACELRDHLMGWQTGGSASSVPSSALAGQPDARGSWPQPPRAAAANHPTLVTALLTESEHQLPRRRRAGIAALAVVAAAAAVAIVVALIMPGSGSGQKPAASSRPKAPAVQAIDVQRDALIGEPASVAVRQLHDDGFRVRVLRVPTNRQAPGRVVSVNPAGPQLPRSLVTLVVASFLGDHHHHGHDHNGNGDGGGNGNDGGGGNGNGGGGNGTSGD